MAAKQRWIVENLSTRPSHVSIVKCEVINILSGAIVGFISVYAVYKNLVYYSIN